MRARGCVCGAAVLAVLLFLPGAAAGAPIAKLEGTAGCVADPASTLPEGTCEEARGIDDATDVAITPDGYHAYVASTSSNSVAAFARDRETGELTQLQGAAGCIVWNEDPDPPPGCAEARGLESPSALAISPDGKNVYVTTFKLDAGAEPTPVIQGTLLSFSRAGRTGALTQLDGGFGCVVGGVNSVVPPAPVQAPPGCATQPLVGTPGAPAPLGTASDVEVSSDGESVVTSSFLPSAVINWDRNDQGVLTPRECFASPDTLFPQTGTTGACDEPLGQGGPADGLAYPLDVEISPDGDRVYAAALGLEQEATVIPPGIEVLPATDEPGSIAVFDRDAGGALDQPDRPAGCIDDTRDPVGGAGSDVCEHETALLNPLRVAVSPDSANVYVSSLNVFPPEGLPGPGPGELAQFTADLDPLDPPCLQQLGLPSGGLIPTAGCSLTSFGLILPSDVAFSPDGSSAYVSSLFHSVGSYARAASGALAQDPPPAGCLIDPRNLDEGTAILGQICTRTVPLNAPTSIEMSPDGKNAYVTSGGFLTGDPTFGPQFAAAGVTSDDAITILGPLPAAPPPEEPPPPLRGLCRGEPPSIAGSGTVRGTSGDDVIITRKPRDRVFGRAGDDLICSGSGADRVSGGAGEDRVFGGPGDDRIAGGADADRLFGEGGDDAVRGGSGDDRVNGGSGRDRLAGGSGTDRCGRAGADRRRSCENEKPG